MYVGGQYVYFADFHHSLSCIQTTCVLDVAITPFPIAENESNNRIVTEIYAKGCSDFKVLLACATYSACLGWYTKKLNFTWYLK